MPAEPPPSGARRRRFAKPVPAERAYVAFRAPAQHHPDWLALEAIAELFFGGPSSRLVRRLVTEMEAATQVDGMVTPLADPGLFEVFATLRQGHEAELVEDVLLGEAARVAAGEVSAADLAKVKRKLETSFWMDLVTGDGKAEALGHFESTLGDWRRLTEVAERTRALTVDDLARAATHYLREEALVSVVAEPSDEDEEMDS